LGGSSTVIATVTAGASAGADVVADVDADADADEVREERIDCLAGFPDTSTFLENRIPGGNFCRSRRNSVVWT
jgi:hypothetical protein